MQGKVKNNYIRNLKVCDFKKRTNSIFRSVKTVPRITIMGDWLLNAGFPINAKVKVNVSHGKLVLERV